MLRAEIERASTEGHTVLLVRAAIRPLPRSGTDLRGRQLPDELIARLTSAHPETKIAVLGSKELILAVPAIEEPRESERILADLFEALAIPVVIDGLPHHLGPRLGAALLDEDSPTIELLQEATQLALDEAGPTRSSMLFHPFQRVRHNLRVNLSADLRTAVVDGDIEAAVQPVYELESRKLVAYEAIARWNRPGHGSVPTSEFVELARSLGVDHILQWQVLDKALALLTPPPVGDDSGHRDPVTLWLPTSPYQVLHPQFGPMVADAAAVHDHIDIGLEMKPSPAADDESVWAVLREMIEDGVRVAVGDFGLGNANLTTLRTHGFNAVKLDRSLIENVGSSTAAETVVGSLLAIADQLQLETTGKGIDRADQADALLAMGCKLGQGSHLAEPTSEPIATPTAP